MFDLYQNNNHKKRIINYSKNKEIEPQEVFLDNLTKKRVEDDGFSDRKIEVPLSRKCFYGLLIFFFVVFFSLFARSFQLQVVKGDEFYKKSEMNRFAFSSIQSSRGVIYDRNHNQLVYNQPIFNLVIDKSEIKEIESVLSKIKNSIDFDYKEVMEKIENSDNDKIILVSNLNHNDLISLQILTRDLSGIEIEKNVIRHYQDDEIFSHVIGYLGKILPEEIESSEGYYSINDYVGRSGIEKQYEKDLRVIPGRMKLERDVFGNIKSEELVSMPKSGKSLVLFLDSDLQSKVYSVLEDNLKEIGSQNAVVIATNPKTGEILSMVSFPGFNNNAFSLKDNDAVQDLFNDPARPLFNRATSGLYPVGSTIKPITAIAALEEGIVNPLKQFYSAGQITIPNPWNPSAPSIFRDWQPHGWVNLRRAIAVSSNVYFYIIGGGYEDQKGLGAKLINEYLSLFGWGKKTEIDLPDEKDGFLPSPEWKEDVRGIPWTIGDTYNFSIGQGDISVTPLQVSYAYNAIANGGNLMKPMIVKEIIDEDKKTIEVKNPEIVKSNFVSKENIEESRKGMRDAVLSGSATLLRGLPVDSAAKTGTAQISKAGHYHNWVSVFAPYDDPEISLTVLIEEVEGVRAAAVPVARDILYWYFSEK